jgi:hypothetical protein
MNRKSYLWLSATWFVAGTALGAYLPRALVLLRLHHRISHLLRIYPLGMQFPLIAFLFLLAFQPVVNVLRRYRHNWSAKARIFTIVDGSALLIFGALGSVLLNGKIARSFSESSHRILLAVLVWSGAFAIFFLSTAICSLFEPTEDIKTPTRDDLMDVPITDDSEDILGRTKFVDDFYSQIRSFPSEDSFVFGINGPWGSGKTSVLNLLRNRLRRDKKIILVDFNPWYFQSAETIIRRFYDGVAHAINQQFFYPSLGSATRRYARALAPLLKRYGIDFASNDEATVEEVKASIESYIAQLGRRIVIIVDDLERAHRDELLTVLQIVRLGANFKNTLFVLAYDQEQISGQLVSLKISPEFLEKIVQSPEDLPAVDKNEIDRYLIYSDSAGHKSHLDQLLDNLEISGPRRTEFDKKSVELYVSHLSAFFPTLRSAKRFLIGLSVRLPAVKDEVHLLDFFLLEILRVEFNPVFQDIRNNPYFYIPPWSTKSILASPLGLEFDAKDKEENRGKVRKHVNELLAAEPQKENILAVLKALFVPRIGDAFGRPGSYGDSTAAAYRADKRLSHPECFDKYFQLAVPKGAIPDAAVEAILAMWLNAPEPEKAILGSLGDLAERNQLVETLERILMFLGKIDAKLIIPLLRAVTLSVKAVGLEEDRSEQNAYFKLILFLLDERVPDAEKKVNAESVLRDSPISVAVRFVVSLAESQSTVMWNLRRSVDISQLRAIVSERFREDFVSPEVDIFAVDKQPLFILYQVGAFGADSAQMINKYVMALLEKEPRYIGKLVGGFLIEYGGGGPHGFQLDQLKSVYDTKRLAELANQAGQNAWGDDKERRAIEEFLRLTGGTGTIPES